MKTVRLLSCFFACTLGSLASAAPVDVTIDPSKRGEAIHPFIYGQFIEHLGRCIYGGIWAEMLEDRKFYYPITPNYAPYRTPANADAGDSPFATEGMKEMQFPVIAASPWEILGDADAVTMTTDKPFVGEHTPLVRDGAGIRQNDLGVVQNMDYPGYVWARPTGKQAVTIEVTLVWGDGPQDRASTRLRFRSGDYSKQSFKLRSGGRSDHARLELRVNGGDALIGTLSLMPGDNVRGMRRDTLALLKELGGTVYRWPGGNFVSGYNWRDGVGDRDRRPPRGNPAWTGVEHNDFGTDEFIDFCREISTEPMITVNTGFGDDSSAAQWVEYVNGRADTYGGGWRAKNGHKAPYDVKYWCVGNEMWGPFQLGWMQLHHYVLKHNRVAKAMHEVDPSLVLVGVGDIEQINRQHDPVQVQRGITWSHGMLEGSADYMDMLSEHFYAGRVPWMPDLKRPDLLTHVKLVKDAIKKKTDGHRALQPTLENLNGRVVPIAMDEWNYWHRDYVYGELGCVYDWSDGLGIAMGLHEFYRQSDIVKVATYAQTVNVIGAIKTTKTAAEFETTGLVLKLYRHHFGELPLELEGDFGPVDISAALSKDERTLTVSVVNPTNETKEYRIVGSGIRLASGAKAWAISAEDEFVHNTPGEPRKVDIRSLGDVDATQPLSVPALTVALFEIPLAQR